MKLDEIRQYLSDYRDKSYQKYRGDFGVAGKEQMAGEWHGRAQGAVAALSFLDQLEQPPGPITYGELADHFAEAVTGTVDGPRAESYGRPENMCYLIAQYWSTYLDRTVRTEDVPVMLLLMKIARHEGHGTADTVLDMAGYAYILAKVKAASEDPDEATT